MKEEKEDKLFRWLVEKLPAGVIAFDGDNAVIYANTAACEIFGRGADDFALHGMAGIFEDSDPAVDVKELLAGGEKRIELRLKDGRWLSVDTAPYGADGLGSILIVSDVTAFRRLEEMKASFLTDSLHLIRTPLTTVSSALSLVMSGRGGTLPAKAAELVAVSASETRRLSVLLDALKELLMLESGLIDKDIIIEPVEICGLIGKVCKDAIRTDPSVEKAIVCRPPEKPVRVRADRERLRWVLSELLANGTRYLRDGGKIYIEADERGDNVALSVRDEGHGMSEDEITRVFDRGFRGANPENRRTGGAGLGLYVVKGLIARMGGDVNIDSATGVGSTMEIILPKG